MNGEYLLDTNIIIALFANEQSVLERLANVMVLVPTIAIGELYYGAYKSERCNANIARIDEFAAANLVLVCDADTARYYGEIKNRLRQQGRPLPENDLWIAALALQYQLPLVSRDDHFNAITGLTMLNW